MFSPYDKFLAKKASSVRTWPPYFYGISKNKSTSLYKTSGKCILEDIFGLEVSQGCGVSHFGDSSKSIIKVRIWKTGWYTIEREEVVTLYSENDNVIFANLQEVKDFDSGHYATKNIRGWSLYSPDNLCLAENVPDYKLFDNGCYATGEYGNLDLYDPNRDLLATKVWDVIVRKNLYARDL